jgi:hypothetical protein
MMLSPSGQSLRKLKFEHCKLQKSTFSTICKLCPQLRWLDMGSDISGAVDSNAELERYPMQFLEVLMYPIYRWPPSSKKNLPNLRLLVLTGADSDPIIPRSGGTSVNVVKRILKGDYSFLVPTVGQANIFVKREGTHLHSLLSELIWNDVSTCLFFSCYLSFF